MISEILAAYANNIRAPNKHRATTLGASDIGQCARKVFYLKRGSERDPSTSTAGARRCAAACSSEHFGYRRCAPASATA